MNKFVGLLSRNGDTIMKDRAMSVGQLAEMAQEELLNGLKRRKIELETRKAEMLDMSPDNRYSLKPGADFRANEWVKEYHQINLDLINLEIEMKVAETTTKELFTEQEQS